jgi:hypothetical protein
MGTRCSRVGCNADAVASYCFDGRAALVWLDPLDPARGLGAGVLCRRHADTLTPPRGWHLQDRRPPAPRLWDDRPAAVPAPPVAVHDVVAPARAPGPPSESLPFVETGDVETGDVETGDVETGDVEAGRPVAPDIDEMLVARTPLLVRAFAGSVLERDE